MNTRRIRILYLVLCLQISGVYVVNGFGVERLPGRRRLASRDSLLRRLQSEDFASAAVSEHRQRPKPSSSSSRKFKNVNEMLQSFDTVLLSFTAANCGPCRLQQRELQQLTCDVLAIDTNRWPKVSSQFQVGKLPSLVLVKNGEVYGRWEGLTLAADLTARLSELKIATDEGLPR